MEDASPTNYVLERSFLASVRLNLLHYLMKEELGYLLHPCITPHDTKPVVCDMGTGTGLWLLDLADASPASSLHGFDIDISQAPPKEWLPATVTIDPLDIFESIPEHLVGKFDIVHVQLFMCVVRDNDPQPVLRKLLELLKPGGWLQWVELDLATRAVHRANESLPVEKLVDMNTFQDRLASRDPRLSPKWVSTLGDSFAEAGLQVMADERKPYRPSRIPIFTDASLMTWYEFKSHMEGGVREKFGSMLREAVDDVAKARRAIGVTVDNHVVVGQKKP